MLCNGTFFAVVLLWRENGQNVEDNTGSLIVRCTFTHLYSRRIKTNHLKCMQGFHSALVSYAHQLLIFSYSHSNLITHIFYEIQNKEHSVEFGLVKTEKQKPNIRA